MIVLLNLCFFYQRSAPITGVLETSSDSEDSEVERVDNQDLLDSSKMEKVFLIGVLDELKIRFNYNCQVVKWILNSCCLIV